MSKAQGPRSKVQWPRPNDQCDAEDEHPPSPGGSDAVAAGEGFSAARPLGFAAELLTIF